MIAKSDLIILTVSTAALVLGLYRWRASWPVPDIAEATPPPVERVVESAPAADLRPDPGGTAAIAGNVAGAGAGKRATADDGPIVVRRVSAADPATASGSDGDAASAVVTATPEQAGSATIDPPADPGSAGSGGEPLYGRYVVESGDYLGLIAERFGTSVAALRSINELEDTTILVGEELLYPLPAN